MEPDSSLSLQTLILWAAVAGIAAVLQIRWLASRWELPRAFRRFLTGVGPILALAAAFYDPRATLLISLILIVGMVVYAILEAVRKTAQE